MAWEDDFIALSDEDRLAFLDGINILMRDLHMAVREVQCVIDRVSEHPELDWTDPTIPEFRTAVDGTLISQAVAFKYDIDNLTIPVLPE